MNSFNEPLSHPPDKKLIDHVNGILKYTDNSLLTKVSVLFHDTGKINPYFQEKLFPGNNSEKYSNHSCFSAYILINCLYDKKINVDLNILSNIVVGHHTCLRNLGEIFTEEWDKMISFLKENDLSNNINGYLSKYKDQYFNSYFLNDYKNNEFYKRIGNYGNKERNLTRWEQNSLEYYFNTIFSFSNLIYGDRKDASQNEQKKRTKDDKMRMSIALQNNLNHLFNKFKTNDLNKIRTDIRLEAKQNLLNNLNTNKRIFTLNAPTGSGKTLMLLDLATTIQEKKNYEYDIIYALPFLSIIDQTCDIIENKLLIDILKYSSTAESSQELQKNIEKTEDNKISEILFNENSFDNTFIVTTFVQLFETFLSNKPSKLLKLRNFSKRIFLIDEIQSLPPSLYKFFYYILDYFCTTYDSYAIISSATMPQFELSDKDKNNKAVNKVFNKYQHEYLELVNNNIFNNRIFNRYTVEYIGEKNKNNLSNNLLKEERSVLCILNTKRTSLDIYSLCKQNNENRFEKIYLLNTYIAPKHRLEKIHNIKDDLKNNKKILVIATQLIEAGVDIDFPIVYRDAANPSSINQSGGRCNRNGNIDNAILYVFLYKRDDDKYDCDYIYPYLSTYYSKIKKFEKTEIEYRKYVDKYFENISEYMDIGYIKKDVNLVNLILNGKFKDLGSFRLIENEKTYTLYIGKDNLWNKYIDLYKNFLNDNSSINKILLENTKRSLLQECIDIKEEGFEKKFDHIKISEETIIGIKKMINSNEMYNKETGIF